MSNGTGGFVSQLSFLSLTIVALIVGVILTGYLMRKNRKPEYGHVKGEAVDPQKILRDNPPEA